MRLESQDLRHGQAMPAPFAAGQRDDAGQVGFAPNLSPQLSWSEVPEGTQSFVLLCVDPDVPSRPDDVNQPGREVPADLPRVDFFHWVLVDLPPVLRAFEQGEWSQGFVTGGKSGPDTLHGARHGLNDYTGWFAGDEQMKGQYFGYDGPFPPFNDLRIHHYHFQLFALDVPRLAVTGAFTGAQVREAMQGHVLAQAELVARYTLHPALKA